MPKHITVNKPGPAVSDPIVVTNTENDDKRLCREAIVRGPSRLLYRDVADSCPSQPGRQVWLETDSPIDVLTAEGWETV